MSGSGRDDRLAEELLRLADEPATGGGRLLEIVRAEGWPSVDRVGRRAAAAAWSVAVACRCSSVLGALSDAVGEGHAHPFHYAYLADGILLARGDGERFGSHHQFGAPFGPTDAAWATAVDRRRAAIGLEPLARGQRLARVQAWVRDTLLPRLVGTTRPSALEVYRDRWGVPTDDPDLVVPLAPFSRMAMLEEGVLPDPGVDVPGGAVSSDGLTDVELVRLLRGVIRSWAEPEDLRFLEADAAAGSRL